MLGRREGMRKGQREEVWMIMEDRDMRERGGVYGRKKGKIKMEKQEKVLQEGSR